MFISKIDNYLDKTIDKFFEYSKEKDLFKKYIKDENFVKYQNDIIDNIKYFIENLNTKEIKENVITDNNTKYIINLLKRYCIFYIYLGISFYYKGSRDLFITNIIETSKNQKDSEFQISNFFNTENNSKIINIFSIIKNILELQQFKTMERIKIILNNNPVKYNTTIELFNELGEDYIEKYFMIDNNFHNIIKTFIFKIIYLNEEKTEINKILNDEEDKTAEYKYIEIILARDEKIIDFTITRFYKFG